MKNWLYLWYQKVCKVCHVNKYNAWHIKYAGHHKVLNVKKYVITWTNTSQYQNWCQSYGRALGPEGKLLFFVLATFYLVISTLLSRNFDFHSSKFRLYNSKYRLLKSKYRVTKSIFWDKETSKYRLKKSILFRLS